MERLPVKDWVIGFSQDSILIAAHLNGGGLYWTKYRLSDFPKYDIAIDDIKSFLVEIVTANEEMNQAKFAATLHLCKMTV
jgi:hypothetical protein